MPFNRASAMRAVHALGAINGYSHEDLREIAASQFGIPSDKVSLAKLTDYQLGKMCEILKGGNKPARVNNGATKRQLWKINQLAALLGMVDGDGRLPGFLFRQVKKHELRDLTKYDAIKVIDGLKNIVDRNAEVRYNPQSK